MADLLNPTVLATLAGAGVALLVTPRAEPRRARRRPAHGRWATWMHRAGLTEVRGLELWSAVAGLFAVSALLSYAFFGGILAALVVGGFTAAWPVAAHRRRSRTRRLVAMEAWPRLIDEIRILTSSAGRSVPQALFEAGRHAPVDIQPAFDAAHREWLLTTDFPRTLTTLKRELADAAVDATCETLLIAHEVGGTDLDHRLEALADDRRDDVQGRKDAKARQAGVRFARRFVLVVPLGMALAGTSVGTGRAAYATPTGQLLVLVALSMVAVCWWWAGRLLVIPEPDRVFPE